MSKQPAAALTSNLVALKGQGAADKNTPVRSQAPAATTDEATGLQPLNFRVSSEFRREFKTFAAAHDLKLNELLKRAFAAYREQQGE